MAKDRSTVACGNCNLPGKVAAMHCLDCKESLCEACLSSHQTFKALKKHRVFTIEEWGSGNITESFNERYCKKHEGEEKRFFCETCEKLVCRDCIVMKQYCRDHDYVTLQEAAEKQTGNVKKALEVCKEVEKKILDTITACEKAENNVRKSKEKLQHSLVEVRRVYGVGERLTNEGSSFEVISKYTETMQPLEKANKMYSIFADVALTNTLVSALHKPWKQVGQFCNPQEHLRGSMNETSQIGITVTAEDYIVVRSMVVGLGVQFHIYDDTITVFTKNGDVKHVFPLMSLMGLGAGLGITSTQDGKLVMLAGCGSTSCLIWDVTGGPNDTSFPTNDIDGKPCSPTCVTVDGQDNILIALNNKVICYDRNGLIISSIKTNCTFQHDIALMGNGVIAGSYNWDLKLIDSSGQTLKCLQPPPEVQKWDPTSICSSKKDELFVFNNGEPKCVYMYMGEGDFVGRVTPVITDRGNCTSIALSHDDKELFVAEEVSNYVRIFQRP